MELYPILRHFPGGDNATASLLSRFAPDRLGKRPCIGLALLVDFALGDEAAGVDEFQSGQPV